MQFWKNKKKNHINSNNDITQELKDSIFVTSLEIYLETHCRVSNNKGVAKAGSLWMKVARTMMQ